MDTTMADASERNEVSGAANAKKAVSSEILNNKLGAENAKKIRDKTQPHFVRSDA